MRQHANNVADAEFCAIQMQTNMIVLHMYQYSRSRLNDQSETQEGFENCK